MTRREFGIAVGAALVNGSRLPATVRPQPPGIKLGSLAPAEPTDEDIAFFKQLGVDVVYCAVPSALNSLEGVLRIKKTYADAGLRVHNVRNLGVTNNQADIVLNRPARDEKIERYKRWLRTIGRAGFHYTITNFNIAQIAISGFAEVRGSRDRDFDLNAPDMGILFGREYSHDEIWANLTYFLKQVVPVAEEEGVVIGLHPDDPPVPSLFGVARVLSTFDGCKKMLTITGSPNVALCLCCGTWAEGGKDMGIDPAGAIRYFGPRKQIYEIHYRNVSAPLPHFHETYVDDGYYDMYKIMKALVEVKYDGIVHLDHFVPMVNGNRTYEAFVMGYMRAMLQRARA
jgi:mannonate dehydratase